MAKTIRSYIYPSNKEGKKLATLNNLCLTQPLIIINCLEKLDIRKAYKKMDLLTLNCLYLQ